jgi:hypothetical protein
VGAAHFGKSGLQGRRKGDREELSVVGNNRDGAPFYRMNGGRGGGSTQVVVWDASNRSVMRGEE